MKSQIKVLKKERKKKRYELGDENLIRRESNEDKDEDELVSKNEMKIDENERKKRKKEKIKVDDKLNTKQTMKSQHLMK